MAIAMMMIPMFHRMPQKYVEMASTRIAAAKTLTVVMQTKTEMG